MGLSDFFAAVQTKMTATLTGLPVPEAVPLFAVGEDKLTIEDAPPRIVFVPRHETIRGPHSQGGDGIRNPRPLRTRHATVQIHVWGAAVAPATDDFAATEKLVNHLVAAIHDVAHGVHEELSGNWSTAQASSTRLGLVYVLEMQIEIPLTRELDTYATVTTIPITPAIIPPS